MFILVSASLLLADDMADLYGIDEPAQPEYSWNAGTSIERGYQDSIASSIWISKHFEKEFHQVTLGLTPEISAYMLGWNDSLQFAEASAEFDFQWKALYIALTPWYSNGPKIDYSEYGLFSELGVAFSPWMNGWWNSYFYYGVMSESNLNYGLYSSLAHNFYWKRLWHGPSVAIDVPFTSESTTKGRRGKGMMSTLTTDPVGYASYRIGFTPMSERFDLWSQLGVASDRSGDIEFWGGAYASVSW